ncbi:MAG: tRNA (guanosine(37)-N1)-methyltransferase TrmD [Lachnospiraceae bacterium]|nr:tRNA (guanosine(37)-N1)-methyltransferase TrmD [Lachnospiraceae bacterium]
MNFHVMTLFPEMIENAMGESITGRAMKAGHIQVNAVNIRDFAENKHNRVDDYPYGGGAGMVMQAGPVYRCYQSICAEIERRRNRSVEDAVLSDEAERTRVIYLTPQGQVFHQKMAQELSREEDLIFLCGHYEGIDERVLEKIVTDYVSIGDYVLTGGELPALVMMDTISRLVPGVLSNGMSAQTESFSDSLLEYPQYTRPEEWMGEVVPPVLLSGHHKNIAAWYREQSILRTAQRRPDMLEKAPLTQKERQWIEQYLSQQ